MPFRHVVLLRFRPDTPAARVDAIVEALHTLPDHVTDLTDYRVGVDAGLAESNWDLAVVADFDDEAGYLTYRDHPDHTRIISELIAPVLDQRAAVQHPT